MRIVRVDECTAVDGVWRLFGPRLNRTGIATLLASPTTHLLAAFSDQDDELGEPGTPIGVVLGSELIGADLSTEMFITLIAVQPLVRRLGVGAALIRSMLALAQERGCARMRGTIAPDNVGAIRVMRTLGATTENVSINASWQLTGPSDP
jgi:ribosomal protein S18 acetylase RimI-like enzyme